MTAHSQIHSSVSSTPKFSASSHSYSPSVPLSVYRELVRELQDTQIELDDLEAENHHLFQQNQQLRSEIQKLVRYAKHLQKVVNSFDDPGDRPASSHSQDISQTSPPLEKPISPKAPKKQVIEIGHSRPGASPSEGGGQINGWLLAIAILLIVMTSCVGAFMLVSSRLSYDRR